VRITTYSELIIVCVAFLTKWLLTYNATLLTSQHHTLTYCRIQEAYHEMYHTLLSYFDGASVFRMTSLRIECTTQSTAMLRE
jgi:hypothetical protein